MPSVCDEVRSDSTRGNLVRRGDGILQIDDHHVRARGEAPFQFPVGVSGDEQQGAHQVGFFSIIAWRTHLATSTSFWLYARCSNSTMPRSGFDLDSRTESTVVSTRIVSPWKTGCAKIVSVMPRFATVVPTVMSLTEMPIMRPSVNSEFTRGLPHSVLAAKSKSICKGWGLSVMTEKRTLSLSVTVLRRGCRNTWPTVNSSR